MNRENIFNILYNVIIFICLFLGFGLRVLTYLYNRSLWHDEASLALSIINDVNLFKPLPHNQFAPQLFLFSTKILANIFGNDEMILRFIPFIFGAASILLFYFLSKEVLQKRLSIIVANFLFAVNYHLIYYCQEFKQYSTDVFFFMLTLVILSKIDLEQINAKRYLFIGTAIILLPMVSLPSFIVVIAWFLTELFRSKFTNIKNLLYFIPFFAVVVIYFIYVLFPAKYNVETAQINFWTDGYLKLNLLFVLKFIKSCYDYCFEPNTYALFSLILSCTGWYYIFRNKESKSIYRLIIVSCFITILLSVFQIYPIYWRTGLFLTPIVILSVVIPMDRIKWVYFVLLFILLTFSSYNFAYIKSFFNKNIFLYKNARAVTEILKEKYKKGDIVIYNSASDSDYEYYTNLMQINISDYAIMQLPNISENEKKVIFEESLSYLKKGKIYIFYFAYNRKNSNELILLENWLKDKNVLWQYKENDSLIAGVKF
ncbi:glycosyltransferase family 39 protein [bacterium]|nr:glycosyltransferase family 39 protein [bacterium]